MKLKCQKFLDCHDWIKPRKQIDMLLGKCLLIKNLCTIRFSIEKNPKNQKTKCLQIMSRKLIT